MALKNEMTETELLKDDGAWFPRAQVEHEAGMIFVAIKRK